jgi:hypothetical protein
MQNVTPNMQLKSFASLTRTKQPVTDIACAISVTERLGRLTECY